MFGKSILLVYVLMVFEDSGTIVLLAFVKKNTHRRKRNYGHCTKKKNVKIEAQYAPIASSPGDSQFIGLPGLWRNEAATYRLSLLRDV